MERLLKLIHENNPKDWAMFFGKDRDGKLELTVEHFPDGYMGDIEQNCGDWEVRGNVWEVTEQLYAKIKENKVMRTPET